MLWHCRFWNMRSASNLFMLYHYHQCPKVHTGDQLTTQCLAWSNSANNGRLNKNSEVALVVSSYMRILLVLLECTATETWEQHDWCCWCCSGSRSARHARSMSGQACHCGQRCFFQLRQLRRVRRSLCALCHYVANRKYLSKCVKRVQVKRFVFQIYRKTVPCRRASAGKCSSASSR